MPAWKKSPGMKMPGACKTPAAHARIGENGAAAARDAHDRIAWQRQPKLE